MHHESVHWYEALDGQLRTLYRSRSWQIEKKNDIQTLMFLGSDKSLIRKIFMREGLMITLSGVLCGLLLGLLMCWIQIKFKPVPFSAGFVVEAYPVKIIPMDLALVFSTVMLIGFFAAWYPVRIFTRKFS